jgi:hypothetical protein
MVNRKQLITLIMLVFITVVESANRPYHINERIFVTFIILSGCCLPVSILIEKISRRFKYPLVLSFVFYQFLAVFIWRGIGIDQDIFGKNLDFIEFDSAILFLGLYCMIYWILDEWFRSKQIRSKGGKKRGSALFTIISLCISGIYLFFIVAFIGYFLWISLLHG